MKTKRFERLVRRNTIISILAAFVIGVAGPKLGDYMYLQSGNKLSYVAGYLALYVGIMSGLHLANKRLINEHNQELIRDIDELGEALISYNITDTETLIRVSDVINKMKESIEKK